MKTHKIPKGCSLEEKFPIISKSWHPTLNGELTPSGISYGNHRDVWWRHYHRKTKVWHTWHATVKSRTRKTLPGCLVCAGYQINIGVNDLAFLNPIIALDWHPTFNGNLTAEMVTIGSHKEIWWRHTDKNTGKEHYWIATVNSRTGKIPQGCAVCAGKQINVGVNDLASTHSRIARSWHPTKNGKLIPQMLTYASNRKVWWRHIDKETGKEYYWIATVASRTGKIPQGCAVCAGYKIIIGINDLAFTNPKIARSWHPTKNGKLTPQMVTRGSHKKVWWRHVDKESSKEHYWIATVNARTNQSGQQGCAVCAGQQVNIGINDLAFTHPKIARSWHPTKNGKLTPQMVSYGSDKEIWWRYVHRDNNKIHEWKTTVGQRVSYPSKCSYCLASSFNSKIPGDLYVITGKLLRQDGKFSQITQFGISNKVELRLRKHRRSGFINEPVNLISFKEGCDALNLENSLKRLMREYEIPTATQRGIKFDGSTEAFLMEDAMNNEDFLEEFKSLVGLE